MKMLSAALPVLLLALNSAYSQDKPTEISPIVVTGTFDLRRTPSPAESFAIYLEKQIEARRATQEAIQRSPIWNAPFWSFVPIRLQSSADLQQFFVPNYSTADYREAARKIDDLSAHSIFK